MWHIFIDGPKFWQAKNRVIGSKQYNLSKEIELTFWIKQALNITSYLKVYQNVKSHFFFLPYKYILIKVNFSAATTLVIASDCYQKLGTVQHT